VADEECEGGTLFGLGGSCLGLRPLDSGMTLASAYRRSEHAGIKTIIVSKLKLRNVQRHIFGAHLAERTDYATFEDRPETFNRIGVNSASVKSRAMAA
jgi:hypothetical protein